MSLNFVDKAYYENLMKLIIENLNQEDILDFYIRHNIKRDAISGGDISSESSKFIKYIVQNKKLLDQFDAFVREPRFNLGEQMDNLKIASEIRQGIRVKSEMKKALSSPQDISARWNISAIRDLLTDAFTESDLRRLAFDEPIFRDVHNSIGSKTGKDVIIDIFLEYCQTRELFQELLIEIRNRSPRKYEKYESKIVVGSETNEPTFSGLIFGENDIKDVKTPKGNPFIKPVITVIVVLALIFSSFAGFQYFTRWTGEVIIDSQPHHLGDVVIGESEVVTNTDGTTQTVIISPFNAPQPEGSEYIKEFLLPGQPSSAFLYVTATHVDPDQEKSPISIFINNTFVDYLNRYYKAESYDVYTVEISVPNGVLQEGNNVIKILVSPEIGTGLLNIDDFEIRDLKIKMR